MEGPIKKAFLYIYVFQQNVFKEVSEAMSSIFQTEQEDVLERGISEAGSTIFKPQETLETQLADESSKLLEEKELTDDLKAAKQMSLKVKHYLG